MHEVQSGDTLSAIAKKHYGDAKAYIRIFEANRPMLKDADDIYPGQVLIIPEQAGAMAWPPGRAFSGAWRPAANVAGRAALRPALHSEARVWVRCSSGGGATTSQCSLSCILPTGTRPRSRRRGRRQPA